MSPEHAGTAGWCATAVGIAAFDLIAPETMSSAFKRGLENPRTRYLVIGAWAITTAHLFQLIPLEYDPFKVLYRHWGGELEENLL